MLKFVFLVLFMISCIGDWYMVQTWLFVGSLLFGVGGLGFGLGLMGYGLGVDYISYLLILLSFWVACLSIMSSQKVLFFNRDESVFSFLVLSLLLVLILTFSCLDYLMFYFCFESSLIPIFILILGWGYQPERLRAASYLLFYTVYGSVPLLISLMCLYSYSGSSVFLLTKVSHDLSGDISFWYFCSVVGFFVKMPVYGVHIWLPKAHVEAPVAGSMILAGVLLKLGGYGVLRLSSSFNIVMLDMVELWVSLGLLGGTYVGIMCLRQVDIKSLIAYSSVSHMGMVLCGVMVFNWWGVTGAVAMMVGHGLCSSGLFCLANIAYERYNSRSLLVSYGLLNLMPSMCLWWFLLSIGNMAAPPALNLLGEIGCIVGVVSWGYLSILSVAGLSFFSAAYTLYLFSSTQHGSPCSSLYACCSGKVREYLVVALHWAPLNLMILKGGVFIF